jgi:hypothetical protein
VSFPQGPGQPGENPYPQSPSGPSQPGAGQYPQPQYPPTPAYPPQFAQPQYGQPPNPAQYAPPAVPAKERNVYATQALIYGAVVFVITIIAFFLGRVLIGALALFVIYAGIRGLIVASIIGLILGAFSLLDPLLGG